MATAPQKFAENPLPVKPTSANYEQIFVPGGTLSRLSFQTSFGVAIAVVSIPASSAIAQTVPGALP
ncbi:MAG: hypothetical protein ACK4NZ_10410, partial [Tsuneonella sp.]